MSTAELTAAGTPALEQSSPEVEIRIDEANKSLANFIFGGQKLMFEELVFATNEMLDRAQTETNILSEFASKMAGAHSVKGLRTMFEECGKHQLEFARRDCDRLFRQGEHMVEAASNLFKSHPLD
jgi:hypothetical protein